MNWRKSIFFDNFYRKCKTKLISDRRERSMRLSIFSQVKIIKELKLGQLLTFVCCFVAFNSFGQQLEKISFSVTTESVAIPMTRLTPIHPGVELGATFWSNDEEKTSKAVNAHLGYYYHEQLFSAFYLRGEYEWMYKPHENIGLSATGGLGYQHSFFPRDLYELNPTTGEYELDNDFGRPALTVDVGIGLTYLNDSPIQPFIKYRAMVQTPFANGIPVIPHNFFQLGASYSLN